MSRNYPNMSYCMCENTLLAMRQIIDAMNMEGPMFIKDMNADELRSYRKLFEVCEDFMSLSELIDEETETEETL